MSQKLDNFNKILLANGTINYMASALEGVRKDYQTIVAINSKKETPDEFSDKVMTEGLASKNEMMDETLKKLCAIIEDLGNYLDGHDIVCPIDARIYSVPLNILLHDMDEEETVYENEEVV